MWADNETNKDLLGYQVHADLLKEVILDPEMLPISIGVFGDWGSGKSSLMLLLYDSIEVWRKDPKNEKERVLQIRFNSWQFEEYEDTKMTLIESILSEIQKDIEEHNDVFENAELFLKKVRYLKLGVFVVKKFAWKLIPSQIQELLPQEEELKNYLDDDAKRLVEEVSKGNTSDFIARFHNDFNKLVSDAGYRAVVVYVDDLDRCEPGRIIQCLEAVKLFVNVDKTAFVIGADERIIENAIKERYKTPLEKTTISSPYSDYLEKLIQLPYKLPKLSASEQETYITLLLCSKVDNPNQFQTIHKKYLDYRKEDKHSLYDLKRIRKDNVGFRFGATEELLPIIPIMTHFLNGNPRQLKRFLNTFDMRRRLAKVAGFEGIKPDILVKLMVLEYNTLLRANIDDLYLRQKETGFISEIKEIEKQAKKGTITNEGWKSLWNDSVKCKWLASAPSLENVNLQNYFWISREALRNEMPLESQVSRIVQAVFNRLMALQTTKLVNNSFPDAIRDFSKEEKSMFILLLNRALHEDIASEGVLRIIDADTDKLLISTVDDIKLLFTGLDTSGLEPGYSDFLKRMSKDPACEQYINSLVLGQTLKNAMKIQ